MIRKVFTSQVFVPAIVLLLSLSILSGCGGREDASGTGGQTYGYPEETVDWKTEGLAVSGDVKINQEWWVTEYIPWKHENVVIEAGQEELYAPNGSFPSKVYGDKIYLLNGIFCPPLITNVRWVLEVYDTAAMSSVVRELPMEQMGLADTPGESFLTAMDLQNEDSFVFQWDSVEKNSEDMFQTVSRMIYLNPEGDVQVADLWDTYLEKGIARENFYEFILLPEPGYCVCDSAGNIFQKAGISENGYTTLYVLNRDGAVLLEYQNEPEQVIGEPLRAETGELIYPVYDVAEHSYSFMWPDTETGEMRLLGTMYDSNRSIRKFFGMQGNFVYYETSEGIVVWNIKSGKRTLVFQYQENGIPKIYQTMLVLREGQTPVLRLYRNADGEKEDWLAPFSEEPVQNENTIRVADLVGSGLGSRQVSECAALMSRKDMNQTVLYQKGDLGGNTFRTQVMAELMAGKGPDILYVSKSDMTLLQELGMLADLRDLVPRETLEELWPGVVSMGTLDGKLVGLPVNIKMLDGLAVARDTWRENTWRLEDVIALMEEGHLEPAVYYPSASVYFAPLGTALRLLDYSLEDSFLIDWEKRESHFEDERLIRLLKLTKSNRDSVSDDTGSWFRGGKSIALLSIASYKQMAHFDVMADSEESNYVGYPAQGDGGNYLDVSGMLLVNVNAKNIKGVETYLEYYLGDTIQELCYTGIPGVYEDALSVRRIHEEEIEQSPEGEYLWRGEELSVMEDGTNSLQRAISFLESCVPAPSQHPDLMKIVSEELDEYYNGTKSAEQTADIIDRRIQIYLDEGN